MTKDKLRDAALTYHSQGRPGKIEVVPTKPYSSQRDLSLAYSPGAVSYTHLDVYKRQDQGIKQGASVLVE